jgi:hypothetical protein
MTQGSGAPCHVSFGFFSGFCGIILAGFQIDPQLESIFQPKARGLHSIWKSRPSRLLETILLDYKVLGGLSYGPP